MATPMDERPRPTLTPLWTPSYSFDGRPRSPMKAPRPPHIYSSSPSSPKTLPTPVYPPGSHEGLMRQHERAMVDRLDQRLRQDKQKSELSPPGSACVSRPLSPITEGQTTASQFVSVSPLPSARRAFQPPPTPASPTSTFPRRLTLVAETRSMLLAGLTDEAGPRQSVPYHARRESQAGQQNFLLEGLRAWGHVYYGEAKNADVFVNAVALRRTSDASSVSEHSITDETPQHSPNLGHQPRRHSVVRARVRPRDIDRKPFLIQREFDLTELRSTIPDPLSAAVPIHLEYARAHLPVLAALIVSGHVREGDVIDLPLPHPESWSNTVAYVYTGQGELTDAVRDNILHLAGKV
ncbi:hypothetical protein ACHAQH_002262 [Verticillium albo-atrum]